MTGTRSLVADIGATNARFGLLDASGRLLHTRTLPCAGHATLEEAARAYLELAQPDAHPVEGAIAIAGPVTGDLLTMTNHPWTFSVKGTRDALGLDRLVVVNDFTAAAMGIPLLPEADRLQVGDGEAVAGEVIGVIGPGTGLGVSGLVQGATGWTALAGEGGHVTMAGVNDRESAVLSQLRQRFSHISAERVISGQGLVNLLRRADAAGRPGAGARFPGGCRHARAGRQRSGLRRSAGDVLRDARHGSRQLGADAGCARRDLHRGRHRAPAGLLLHPLDIPRALRGKRPPARLSQPHPDICGDPRATGVPGPEGGAGSG